MEESGQSGMKPKTRKKMHLIDAAYKHCTQMMRQDESYRAYIGNISKEIGKGLNICQIQVRDHRAQEERAKRYADTLMHGDVNAKTDEEDPAGIPTVCSSLLMLQGTGHQRYTPRKILHRENLREKCTPTAKKMVR